MSRRVRLLLLAPALLGLGALFAWAIAGLPAFGDYRGPYGFVLNRIVVPLRHTTNVVMGTNFDVRGIDTMGEEFILYAAVVGVTLLLRDETRSRAGGAADAAAPERHRAARRCRSWSAPGSSSGSGSWPSGTSRPAAASRAASSLAGAILLLYLVGNHRDYRPFRNEHVLDPLEAIGAGGYVIIGLAALASRRRVPDEPLRLGTPGRSARAAASRVLNWASAIAVTVAMLLLFAEFLETYVVPLEPEDAAS